MTAFLINELDLRGGTHRQFLELLDYASSQGEKFVIITKRLNLDQTYPGFSKYADKIRILRDMPPMRWWKRFSYGWLCYIRYFRGLIKDVNVINVHDCGFERYFFIFFGKKVIWQINDLPFIFYEGIAKKCVVNNRNHREKWCIKILTRLFVDQITVNVGKNAERVERQLGRHATVLYCGISPINVVHENNATLDRFGQNKIRLLSSGVFFPYRNYETLVDVIELLQGEGIDASLNIFGSTQRCPDYYQKIQTMVEQKGLSGSVKILGQIDEAQYRALHEESDMFCFINVDQSWGLAVFEAMSAGLPVIVSRSVGATEMLHDGVDATFVDPMDAREIADQIVRLMRSFETYVGIQAAEIKLVGRYSWKDAYCKPMLELIRSL